MPRITCRQPSSANPVPIRAWSVGTGWTTLAEAPDFSVPDGNNVFPDRDPADSRRGIRPGEVWFETPLAVRNLTGAALWFEVRILTHDGNTIERERITVPAHETAYVPLQGSRLMKPVPASANGDRLQVRAETPSTFHVHGAAHNRPMDLHLGVV